MTFYYMKYIKVNLLPQKSDDFLDTNSYVLKPNTITNSYVWNWTIQIYETKQKVDYLCLKSQQPNFSYVCYKFIKWRFKMYSAFEQSYCIFLLVQTFEGDWIKNF